MSQFIHLGVWAISIRNKTISSVEGQKFTQGKNNPLYSIVIVLLHWLTVPLCSREDSYWCPCTSADNQMIGQSPRSCPLFSPNHHTSYSWQESPINSNKLWISHSCSRAFYHNILFSTLSIATKITLACSIANTSELQTLCMIITNETEILQTLI